MRLEGQGAIRAIRGRGRRAVLATALAAVFVLALEPGRAAAAIAPTVVRVAHDAVESSDGTPRWPAVVDVEVLLALEVGGAAVVELPRRPARTVVVEGMERHPDGSLTWRATVAGAPGRPVTITVGPNGFAGSLVDEVEGSVVLESDDEGTWVVDRAAAGLE
ncbi:MAG: hypothetical protein ACKOCT_06165, partial [Alphaproteobacteria bacterium]